MHNDKTDSWFEQHPVMTTLFIVLVLLVAVEGLMHFLYWAGALPKNIIYMTQLEKVAYREHVNKIVYQDGVPRRDKGLTTYTQRGIPNQYIEFDEHGMRVDGYQGRTGEDLIIGIFGDSYTDALQVGQDEVYTAILEQRLRGSGCKIDFRNYGLGATGTSVQYLRYKQRKADGEKFDHVIVVMFLGNDILNNHPALDGLFPKSYTSYPYFTLSNGRLARVDWVADERAVLWKRVKEFMREYSHLANSIFNLTTVYTAYAHSKSGGGPSAHGSNRSVMDYIYGEPPDDTWREAWQATEEVLKEWRKETKAAGEKMFLVFLTESIQLDGDYANPKRLDLDYPNRRMSEFARANGIPFMDFLPYARREVAQRGMKYPFLSWEFDGHYSQVGHRMLADFLEHQLRRESHCAPVYNK